jgi:hypothetical protein
VNLGFTLWLGSIGKVDNHFNGIGYNANAKVILETMELA